VLFRDRDDAGELLADTLLNFAGQKPVVVAASAGGVIVARHVADRLRAPLGLVRDGDVVDAEVARQASARLVLLIDDGIRTGATANAALEVVAARHPQRIVVAVPVAPQRIRLSRLAADLYAIARPAPFSSVRQWYRQFDEISEETVRAALAGHEGQDWAYAGATSL
jgi:predicted phosphoribosyltransferase